MLAVRPAEFEPARQATGNAAVIVMVNICAAQQCAADGTLSEIRHASSRKRTGSPRAAGCFELPLAPCPWVYRDTAFVDRPIWLEHALERTRGRVNDNRIADLRHQASPIEYPTDIATVVRLI
jgi:hypothetical protein